MRDTEVTYSVVDGLRPRKPENAAAIGFSDSLWYFVERCWHGNMKPRPKVAEVVSQLDRVARNWNGLMPPGIQVEGSAPASEGPMSDSVEHCEFNISIPSSHCKLNSGAGIFPPFVASKGPTESSATSGSSSHSSMSSTQYTEPSRGTQRATTSKHIHVPPKEPPLPVLPPRESDDLPDRPLFPHLEQDYRAPVSYIPQKKPRGVGAILKSRFLRLARRLSGKIPDDPN
jgi:hypothetical protein